MTITNNSPQGYTFQAQLVGADGKPVTARTCTLDAARDLLVQAGVDQEPVFLTALEAVLEVLPPSRTFTGIDLAEAVAPAASDFEALEHLRRLAFTAQVDEPEQLRLWKDAAV